MYAIRSYYDQFGWTIVNAGIAPAMVLALIAVIWLALRQRRPSAA